MNSVTEEYRGYAISVTPMKDHDDLWDFQYSITRLDASQQLDGAASQSRSMTMGGHANAAIAATAGLEVARTEIDNRLAMGRI